VKHVQRGSVPCLGAAVAHQYAGDDRGEKEKSWQGQVGQIVHAVDAPPGGQEKGQTQQLVEAAGDFGAPFGFKGNAADDSGHFDTWKQAQAGGARSGGVL